MLPDEIRMCDDAIILISNKAPLKCKMVPYYENIWVNHFFKKPPYQLPDKVVNDPTPIPFF